MWIYVLVGLIWVGIFASLFSSLFFLVRDGNSSTRSVKALAFRVGFSVMLLLALLLANKFGLIEPHSVQEPIHAATGETNL